VKQVNYELDIWREEGSRHRLRFFCNDELSMDTPAAVESPDSVCAWLIFASIINSMFSQTRMKCVAWHLRSVNGSFLCFASSGRPAILPQTFEFCAEATNSAATTAVCVFIVLIFGLGYYGFHKCKGKVASVVNLAPCHEDVFGEWRYSSRRTQARY